MLSGPLQLVSDISALIIKSLVSVQFRIKCSTGGKSCLRKSADSWVAALELQTALARLSKASSIGKAKHNSLLV